MALWRAATKKGFRAWCYEFGLAGSFTHTVAIVEAGGVLQIHDAFFNLTYPFGFYELLSELRDGRPVAAKTETRDRKIYVMDPAFEPEAAVRWLETNEPWLPLREPLVSAELTTARLVYLTENGPPLPPITQFSVPLS